MAPTSQSVAGSRSCLTLVSAGAAISDNNAAEPGTEDAERLELAVVLGTQALVD